MRGVFTESVKLDVVLSSSIWFSPTITFVTPFARSCGSNVSRTTIALAENPVAESAAAILPTAAKPALTACVSADPPPSGFPELWISITSGPPLYTYSRLKTILGPQGSGVAPAAAVPGYTPASSDCDPLRTCTRPCTFVSNVVLIVAGVRPDVARKIE